MMGAIRVCRVNTRNYLPQVVEPERHVYDRRAPTLGMTSPLGMATPFWKNVLVFFSHALMLI